MVKSIKYEIKELKVHTDERGSLMEMLKENELKEKIKQVYVATIEPGKITGNHYHLKRIEWFLIVGGEAKIYLKDCETEEKKTISLSVNKPRIVTIFPKIAHAVKNTGEKTVYLVSGQNTIYNPKNTDTFPYLVHKWKKI